jgi:hypothetical protein
MANALLQKNQLRDDKIVVFFIQGWTNDQGPRL